MEGKAFIDIDMLMGDDIIDDFDKKITIPVEQSIDSDGNISIDLYKIVTNLYKLVGNSNES